MGSPGICQTALWWWGTAAYAPAGKGGGLWRGDSSLRVPHRPRISLDLEEGQDLEARMAWVNRPLPGLCWLCEEIFPSARQVQPVGIAKTCYH